MKRVPSIDKIESIGGIDRADAIRIRRLLDGRDDPADTEEGKKYIASCFSQPDHVDLTLEVIDKILGTCGIEALHAESIYDWYYQDIAALYCNNGQSYDATILYDIDRMAFYVTSWADWVETAERNGRYRFQ